MATTTQHIIARNDPDLLDRFVAAAEQEGVPDASAWVQANLGALIAAEVEGGQVIAATPERAGASLAAVTDTHLTTALDDSTRRRACDRTGPGYGGGVIVMAECSLRRGAYRG